MTRGEAARGDLALGDRHAPLGQLAWACPDAPELLDRGAIAAAPARLQAVALDLGVVDDEVRESGVEELPLLALAEHDQPLAAQLLGHQRTGVPPEEIAHLAGPGLVEPQTQLPEVRVRFEDAALERARVRRKRCGVALGIRFARREVLIVRHRPSGRRRGGCRQRRCGEPG